MELHWLPIKARIEYKVLLTTYKALNNIAPTYISSLLSYYIPNRELRSSKLNELVIPKSKFKTMGDRAFSVAAPRYWNKFKLKEANISLNIFKAHIKTYLFRKYYSE